MGRGPTIKAPLTEAQELEALRHLKEWGRHLVLEKKLADEAKLCEREGKAAAQDMREAWAAETDRWVHQRQLLLATVLNVMRGRPSISTASRRIFVEQLRENAIDSVERLLADPESDVRARALRKHDRRRAAHYVSALMVATHPEQTVDIRVVRSKLDQLLARRPKLKDTRRTGPTQMATLIVADFLELGQQQLERGVVRRRQAHRRIRSE